MMKNINWKKIFILTTWILAGTGTLCLLVAAMQEKVRLHCSEVKIEISGTEQNMFIDEKDVLETINSTGKIDGKEMNTVNLRAMEAALEKNLWIQNAEMFFDNNRVLQVRITERQPVARVFSVEGNSFYIDSNGLRLPLSEKLSARVPVFTDFPSDKIVLSQPDSMLLRDMVKLGKYIVADSFWMAQVEQIEINPQNGFEIVPAIGDHIVVLGDAEELENKFRRLYAFYKQAWLQTGMSKYEKLDLRFMGQVVAVKRGSVKVLADSARAMQLVNGLVTHTNVKLGDTVSVPPKQQAVIPGKNLITNKQNKISNNALSSQQNAVITNGRVNPAMKKQPKAVMKKG